MSRFQGKRVSTPWGIILRAAVREKGDFFRLNDGQRSMADQRQRVRDHGVWSLSNPTGAAIPSPTAPHIKKGHKNHAVDVDSWNDGENKLQTWAGRQGLTLVNNVSTERWHLDPVDEAQFLAVAAKLKPPTKRERLKRELSHLRSWVRTRRKGDWSKAPKRKKRADAIKRFLRRHK